MAISARFLFPQGHHVQDHGCNGTALHDADQGDLVEIAQQPADDHGRSRHAQQ
jgi:hypothetical protein